MKTRMLLMTMCLFVFSFMVHADETVTVSATNSDISENLDLRMVATLFGQAKDLEQFEQMLNNPDSAFSNLDLNGDGNVDYLRVVETADQDRHLVVIQAVLAKDVYQDVASIFVEKDPESESVTVQVIGDEYIYGADYIIEPVYIYRPMIYDWFWGPSWVCWHSPYYWDYWPIWWHPYHCIAHHLYWDHCYWHHHYYPICTYRTGHHYHAQYRPMRQTVSRSDYATRHPERSFATRNASRNISNARSFDRERHVAVRTANASRTNVNSGSATTRVSNRSVATASRTFGSSNVRTNDRIATTGRTTTTRVNSTPSRSQAVTNRTNTTTSRGSSVSTTTRRSSNTVATPMRSSSTTNRVSTATRTTTTPSVNRSSNSSATRSSSSSSMRSSSSSSMRSSGTSVRSSGSSSMRSSGGGTMRSSGGGSSSRGGGSVRR